MYPFLNMAANPSSLWYTTSRHVLYGLMKSNIKQCLAVKILFLLSFIWLIYLYLWNIVKSSLFVYGVSQGVLLVTLLISFILILRWHISCWEIELKKKYWLLRIRGVVKRITETLWWVKFVSVFRFFIPVNKLKHKSLTNRFSFWFSSWNMSKK